MADANRHLRLALLEAISSAESAMGSFLPPKGAPLAAADKRLQKQWSSRIKSWKNMLRQLGGPRSNEWATFDEYEASR